MNSIKLLSAAALLAVVSSGAFASELDGVSDNAWLNQTQISQTASVRPAPAPTAAAGVRQDRESNAVGQFDELSRAVTP